MLGSRTNDIVQVDNFLTDFGSHAVDVSLTGRTEVTILDNLRTISIQLHGRIVNMGGGITGFRVLVVKKHVFNLIVAYRGLLGYGLSNNLQALITVLKNAYDIAVTDTEVTLTSTMVNQIINCNDEIAVNLNKTWSSVFAIRFATGGGVNKDVSIDGKQLILSKIMSSLSGVGKEDFIDECRKVGQLSGVRTARQVEARDLISDLIFSKHPSYVSLNDIFTETDKQRRVIKEFRTDILFTPCDRFRDLYRGHEVRTMFDVKVNNDIVVVKAKSFERISFVVKNRSYETITITIVASKLDGIQKIAPLNQIQVSGTSLEVSKDNFNKLTINGFADIRKCLKTGNSMARLALDGKLGSDEELTNLFLQICSPIRPYSYAILDSMQQNELFNYVAAAIGDWIKAAINGMHADSLYTNWTVDSSTPERERILYVYLLAFIVPEMLLNPTLRFTVGSGTPASFNDYAYFSRKVRSLYG